MEERSPGTGDSLSPTHQASPEHVRKRQRSNSIPDASPYDDVFGGGSWRYSRVSDPDIDYNAQSSKRYLSEVMAKNLTRHMNLRPSNSAGASALLAGAPCSPGDDALAQALQHTSPHPHHYPAPHSIPRPNGPGPMTPPGGCSPQRTCASEMSEGPPDPGGDVLQPMNTSDASFSVSASQGGIGVWGAGPGLGLGKPPATPTADSTSETADSELLDERERSVSLSGLLWGPESFAATPGFAPTSAGTLGFGGSGNVRMPSPHGGAWPTSVAASTYCGSGATGFGGSTGSPFSSQGALPRRLSDISQGPATVGPSSVLQQQQHSMRSQLPRGHASGGRGLLTDIPTSPSDTRFGGLDLRKTALLRSISRRAEETTSDGGAGGGAATGMGNTASLHAGGSSGAGLMAESSNLEDGIATQMGANVSTAGSVVPKGFSRGRPGNGGGSGARSVVSLSDSGCLSDGMSEGGGSGGGGGGVTGMELSSGSADVGGGGGGTGRVSGGAMGEPINYQDRHQQQHQLLLQELLLQQLQAESREAPLPELPEALEHMHSQIFVATAQAHQLCDATTPGDICSGSAGEAETCGTALPPTHSSTLCSPTDIRHLPTHPIHMLRGDGDALISPGPSPHSS